MPRWEPDARARLERAALELFVAKGFEATTAAAIAERAGLTERTFFRHFADKREALHARSSALQDFMVEAVARAPETSTPLEMAISALQAADVLFPARRERSRERQSVIAANPELAERELTKLTALSGALAGALRGRGVGDPVAHLAAELTITVFKVAFERWVDESNHHDFPQLVEQSLDELRSVVAARPMSSRSSTGRQL